MLDAAGSNGTSSRGLAADMALAVSGAQRPGRPGGWAPQASALHTAFAAAGRQPVMPPPQQPPAPQSPQEQHQQQGQQHSTGPPDAAGDGVALKSLLLLGGGTDDEARAEAGIEPQGLPAAAAGLHTPNIDSPPARQPQPRGSSSWRRKRLPREPSAGGGLLLQPAAVGGGSAGGGYGSSFGLVGSAPGAAPRHSAHALGARRAVSHRRMRARLATHWFGRERGAGMLWCGASTLPQWELRELAMQQRSTCCSAVHCSSGRVLHGLNAYVAACLPSLAVCMART